jgi:putative transcriptional regulator
MIRCHLSRMMGERKMRVTDVSRLTGIHRNMITLLYRETATRVDLADVEKLCTLFDCGVGELFELVDVTKGKAKK